MKNDVKNIVDWFSTPGASIRARMHHLGITASKLAEHLEGGIDEVRGLLSGRKPITDISARVLGDLLGGTQDFWIKRQENFDIAFERALSAALDSHDDWVRNIPVPPIRNYETSYEKGLRREIRHRMLFYNVPTFASWEQRYGKICRCTHFRRSNSFTPLESSVLRWLRLGEIEADLIHTQSWSSEKLKSQLPNIRKLTKISRPDRFLPELRSLCAEAGVAVVIGKTPKGCHASGAVRLLSSKKAMMLLSFRHLTDDQFWFTVFHEIGHLLLHQSKTFVDGENYDQNSKYETEANDFAENQIIPKELRAQLSVLKIDRTSVMRFGVRCGVAPGLIVGQLQHKEIIKHNKMNSLKRKWKRKDIDHNFI